MQAGVPIVPVVIHNAIDVAPRGQFVIRPATVKITVLPAVSTKSWKAKTMNQHVHQIRDLFLEELDQMKFQPTSDEFIKLNKVKQKTKVNKKDKPITKKADRLEKKAVTDKNIKPKARTTSNTKNKKAVKQETAKMTDNKKSVVIKIQTPAALKDKNISSRRKRQRTVKTKVSAKTK